VRVSSLVSKGKIGGEIRLRTHLGSGLSDHIVSKLWKQSLDKMTVS